MTIIKIGDTYMNLDRINSVRSDGHTVFVSGDHPDSDYAFEINDDNEQDINDLFDFLKLKKINKPTPKQY